MTAPIRRSFKYCRTVGLLYPLSPATASGRTRGRPRPARLTDPRSISSGSIGCSCRSPPVSTTTIGLPRRSHRRWIFVLYPPRLRPSASAAGSPLGSGGVLVGSNHGAIDEVETPVEPPLRVRLPLESSQDPVPDPCLLPAVEAGRDRLPRAIALRQGAPGTARIQDPEDAVNDGAMVPGGTTSVGLLRWKQREKSFPLHVSQFVRCHTAKRRTSRGLRTRPSWSPS